MGASVYICVVDIRFATSDRDPINQCLSMLWNTYTSSFQPIKTIIPTILRNTCVNFPVYQTNRAKWKAHAQFAFELLSLCLSEERIIVWLYLISHFGPILMGFSQTFEMLSNICIFILSYLQKLIGSTVSSNAICKESQQGMYRWNHILYYFDIVWWESF